MNDQVARVIAQHRTPPFVPLVEIGCALLLSAFAGWSGWQEFAVGSHGAVWVGMPLFMFACLSIGDAVHRLSTNRLLQKIERASSAV